MSETRIIFPDFREEQADSRYPFVDSATLVASGSKLAIANDTFLDASIYAVGVANQVYVSSVVVDNNSITIYIGDDKLKQRAWSTFDPLDDNITELRFVDTYGRDAGVMVTDPDRIRVFSSWPVGTHVFERAATELVPTCVLPTPEVGVRGLLTEKGELLVGDVWLVGDNGVIVREDDGQIRIDIVGDPLFVRRNCVPLSLFAPPRFVQTINGCGPDPYGNFQLNPLDHVSPDTILRIYPDGDGLKIDVVGRKV